MKYIVAIIMLIIAGAAIAQDIPSETSERTAPVCPTPLTQEIILEAGSYSITGSVIEATGGLCFQRGNRFLTASEACYDLDTQSGYFKNVSFTTCDRANPDYHIEASEIKLLPNGFLKAKRATLYLGRTRIITLPVIRMRVGGRNATTDLFPTPGYDQDDGYTLWKSFEVIADNRFQARAEATLTTKMGVQGQGFGRYGLDGRLLRYPGRFMTYSSLKAGIMELPMDPGAMGCVTTDFPDEKPAKLRGAALYSFRQRTFDIDDTRLVLYRQPELVVDYVGDQLSITRQPLDPRLEIYPQAFVSWGHFREEPSNINFLDRTSVGLTAPVNLLDLGPETSFQGVVSGSWSDYTNGDDYRVFSYGADFSRMFAKESVFTLRYMKRNESGTTPFQFDNIDVGEEIQAGVFAKLKRHNFGFVAAYDVQDDALYDWETMYGYQTDCLSVWATWNNRFRRFSAHIRLINL